MANKMRQSSSTSADGSGSNSSSPLEKLRQSSRAQSVRWANIPEREFVRLLEGLTDAGALVGLSRTSDGGALRLYVKDGREEEKLYSSTPEELRDNLAALATAYGIDVAK